MFEYFNTKRKIPGIAKLVKVCQSSRYPETSSQCDVKLTQHLIRKI